jgi:phosphoribosylamine--glycine ligase/phosphoribosylformylglycinamidine cyclo-ligase
MALYYTFHNLQFLTIDILLLRNGGCEHALAWKLSQSPKVNQIVVVPGNAGTAGVPKTYNHSDTAIDDYPGLVALAQKLEIGLVVVCPASAIVDNIEEHFRSSTLAFLH